MSALNVNGREHTVDADADTPILWALRDTLGQTVTRKADAPTADPAGPASKLLGNRARRAALGRQQHDTSSLNHPMFSLGRSDHGLKHRPFLLRQDDRRRFLDVHSILESRLRLQR